MTHAALPSFRGSITQWLAWAILVLPLFGLFLDSVLPYGARLLAGMLWALCISPSVVYAKTPVDKRPPVPMMPLIGLMYGLYYPLSVMLGAEGLTQMPGLTPSIHYGPAIEAATAVWVMILVGYWAASGALPLASMHRQLTSLPDEVLAKRASIMLIGGIVLEWVLYSFDIPTSIESLLRFGTSIGRLGLVFLVIQWVRGRLKSIMKTVCVSGLMVLTILQLGTGSVAPIAILFATIGFSVWGGRGGFRPREFVAFIIVICFIVAYKGILENYRDIVWYGGDSVTTIERVGILNGLLSDQINETGGGGAIAEGADRIVFRSANIELLADVMWRTPLEVPYWRGATYVSLIGAFIPRVIWPGKPLKTLGQDFGHRYRYIGATNEHTSINLPWLVEFYANFGWFGIWAGGLVIGAILGWLTAKMNSAGQPALMSGVFVVLTTPILNMESDFSLTYGGLILNGLAIMMVVRALTHGGGRRAQSAGSRHAFRAQLTHE